MAKPGREFWIERHGWLTGQTAEICWSWFMVWDLVRCLSRDVGRMRIGSLREPLRGLGVTNRMLRKALGAAERAGAITITPDGCLIVHGLIDRDFMAAGVTSTARTRKMRARERGLRPQDLGKPVYTTTDAMRVHEVFDGRYVVPQAFEVGVVRAANSLIGLVDDPMEYLIGKAQDFVDKQEEEGERVWYLDCPLRWLESMMYSEWGMNITPYKDDAFEAMMVP